MQMRGYPNASLTAPNASLTAYANANASLTAC